MHCLYDIRSLIQPNVWGQQCSDRIVSLYNRPSNVYIIKLLCEGLVEVICKAYRKLRGIYFVDFVTAELNNWML